MKTLLVLVLLMFSCATSKPVWVHPNFSQAQFDADVQRCQKQATLYAQSNQGLSPDIKTNFLQTLLGEKQVNYDICFRECMKQLGYRLEQKK